MVMVPLPETYKFVLRVPPPNALLSSVSNAANNNKIVSGSLSNPCNNNTTTSPAAGSLSCRNRNKKRVVMATENKKMRTENYLRHVESLATKPSGACNISHLNAVVLGDALATEENDLIFPSHDFSSQAHVPSTHEVCDLTILQHSISICDDALQYHISSIIIEQSMGFFSLYIQSCSSISFYLSSVPGDVQKVHRGSCWILVGYCFPVLLETELGRSSLL